MEKVNIAVDYTTWFIIVQIIIQLILKSSIDKIWDLFLMMQLLAIIPIYRTRIPANIETVLDVFSTVVKFEFLKPDIILGLISPGTTVASIIGDTKQQSYELSSELASVKIQSSSMLVNMSIYFFVAALLVILVLILLVLSKVKPIREKVKEILLKLKNGFMWNKSIRSITLSYLHFSIQLLVYFRLESTMAQKVLLTIFLIGWPILSAIVLVKNRDNLESLRPKIELFFGGINLTRDKQTILFYAIFISRRFIFVMTTLVIEQSYF